MHQVDEEPGALFHSVFTPMWRTVMFSPNRLADIDSTFEEWKHKRQFDRKNTERWNDMCKSKRTIFVVASLLLSFVLLLGLAYTKERAKFIQKANALFDPKGKAFTGAFLPWPIGHPSLIGGFDPQTVRRIGASLGNGSGSTRTNGMTLVIYQSDGTFFVHAK